MIFLNLKGDFQMKISSETKQVSRQVSNQLLRDELMNAKLYDNLSFQYILDREIQRRMKNNNFSVTSKK